MKMNESNVRRGRVFRGARDRIVETDIVLGRTQKNLDASRTSLDHARREIGNWEELFSGPLMREFGDRVASDMARSLAAGISAEFVKILENDDELRGVLIGEALDKMCYDTGNNLAMIVRDRFLSTAECDVRSYSSPVDFQQTAYVRVRVPAHEINVAMRLDR